MCKEIASHSQQHHSTAEQHFHHPANQDSKFAESAIAHLCSCQMLLNADSNSYLVEQLSKVQMIAIHRGICLLW